MRRGQDMTVSVRASLRQAAQRLPLKWRLALISFSLLAILMAALGAVVSVTQEQAMLGNEATSLRQQAQLALGGFGPGGPPSTPPPPPAAFPSDALGSASVLVHRATSLYTRAAVLTTSGALIVTDDQEPSAPPLVVPSQDALINTLSSAQPADAYVTVRADNGQRQLVILLPLTDQRGQNTVAFLELSTPTAPIDRAVAATRITLGVGVLIALAIAAALTIPLVNAALRPLVAMERASRRIAGGELSLRLDEPPTEDEIGRLARAFNRMVAQLEAAFARQKQFVADVSHELRTPLTALGGGLEMLLLGADRGDPAASGRLMRGLYAEVGRMRRLVEDLLTLARLDEGRAVLRIETMDASQLLSEVYEEAEGLSRGHELHSDIAAGLPRVRVDGDRLRQVLLAILDNAVKYTPPAGHITLRARRVEDRGLLIEIQDTGAGIPPEDLPHVFERFYRVDQARERTSPSSGGSGLGLAIAHSLVQAQGGRIAISSVLGGGTTVSIWFPEAPPAPPSAPHSDIPRHTAVATPETASGAR